MAGDVLEKSDRWLDLSEDALDVRPEVALVIDASTLAGEGEGLAGVAARDDIHASTPASAVEGGEVVPDRSRSHDSFLHARDQARGGMGFPLHETDGAVGVSEGKVESEFQPADPGT